VEEYESYKVKTSAWNEATVTLLNLITDESIIMLKLIACFTNFKLDRCCAGKVDPILSAVFLLSASAFFGALIVKIMRWHHRRGHMPTRGGLEREAAYGGIFATRPQLKRITIWAALGALLWAFCEGVLLLGTSSFPNSVTFSKQLENVVVNETVNLVPEGVIEKGAKFSSINSPCQRVKWTTADSPVDEILILQRCWTFYPLSSEQQKEFASNQNGLPADVTILFWVPPETPYEVVFVANANSTFSLVAFTTAYFAGKDDSAFVRWPDDNGAHVKQLVPFVQNVLTQLGCTEAQKPSSVDAQDSLFVFVIVSCKNLSTDTTDLLAEVAFEIGSLLLNHVDLHEVPQGDGGGFKSSFPAKGEDALPQGSPFDKKSVKVGEVDRPLFNVVTCAILCAIGVLGYLILSWIPQFDATQAVLDHYDAVKQTYEGNARECVDGAVHVDVKKDLDTFKRGAERAGTENGE
jgi:hypothetical protein